MPFRSILVPLDGTVFGEHALPYALSFARRSGARLELAHSHVPRKLFDLPDSHVPIPNDHEDLSRTQARDYLQALARRLNAASPDVKAGCTLLEGIVPEGLCEFIVRTSPDLVVMTTSGRSALAKLYRGSMAREIGRRTRAPLMLVRPTTESPNLIADLAPKRILIPLDGSPLGDQVVAMASELGTLCKAEYRLLRVVPPGAGNATDGSQNAVGNKELQAEEDYLAGMIDRFPKCCTVQPHVAKAWPPASAILADANANGIGLIALGTHRRGRLAQLLSGSVADKVVRGATMPVLLHRPPPN